MNMPKSNESGHSLTVKIVLKGQYEYIQNPEFQSQALGGFVKIFLPKKHFWVALALGPSLHSSSSKNNRINAVYISSHFLWQSFKLSPKSIQGLNFLDFPPSQHKVQILLSSFILHLKKFLPGWEKQALQYKMISTEKYPGWDGWPPFFRMMMVNDCYILISSYGQYYSWNIE